MGRPRLEKVGQRFGKWTLIEPLYKTRKWRCRCDCGTIKDVRTDALKAGATLSCGCDTKRLQRKAKIEQGSKHRLEGQRFGRWTVIKYVGDSKWLCECSCGCKKKIQTGELRFGATQMCKSCAIEEQRKNPRKTHGESDTKLYSVFYAMHGRCEYEKDAGYKWYGARGIKVCEAWSGENGYISFAKWAKENGYEEGLEIDRIDTNGDYEPDNCRWATRTENMNNVRSNHRVTINGETKTIAEWARYYNVPYSIFRGRYVLYGWTLESTLNIPLTRGLTKEQRNQIKRRTDR